MLHLLNGDATAAVFPDGLPGERAVWRDILMEGPADADIGARAAWLAPRLGITAEAYVQGWREGEAILARAGDHEEVVLWFERDLFCAINLWFVLARLEAPRVCLVFPAVGDDAPGLSRLTPAKLEMLFETRHALSADELAEARELWRAYAASDPRPLARLAPAFPFALAAIRLHCGRFPSVTHGLDEVEAETLGALVHPREFGALFREVTASSLRELGMGDVQFAAILRDLRSPTPLVAIEHEHQPFAQWRLSSTALAADVVAGRVDRLALAPLDRWLGGVHLRPGASVWRWDAGRLTLMPS